MNDYFDEMADEKKWHELGRFAKYQSQNSLKEIDLGNGEESKPIYISQLLAEENQAKFNNLLKEYKDCFAWNYHEMSGLDRSIDEHHFQIKDDFRPHRQASRRMEPHVISGIKEEVERLLAAKFIRPCQYTEWLSNVVPVTKKNGK